MEARRVSRYTRELSLLRLRGSLAARVGGKVHSNLARQAQCVSALSMIPTAQSGRVASWELLCACCASRPVAANILETLQRPFDWPSLLVLARDHGVFPLLAKALAETDAIAALPASLRQELEETRRKHVLFTLSLTAEFFRVADRFQAAGIEAVVVKGPVLGVQAFGDPGLRQYSDLDLVLRHADVLRAARIMEECGFASQVPLDAAAKKIPGQFLFVREQTRSIVELHTERTLRYFTRPIPIESFFARRTQVSLDGRRVPALCPEDTLVFICVHGSKHFWERLMWIADVAGLLNRQMALDWGRVFAVARETRTERMVRLGLCLARDVLGAELHPQAATEVSGNPVAARLAVEIQRKLPLGEPSSKTAFGRAMIRMRMGGGFFRGARYLLRLAFSPTEEDWGGGRPGNRAAWMDAVRRPLRLARKHHIAPESREEEKSSSPKAENQPAPETRKARV